MNTKLQAITDENGHPIHVFQTARQVSDDIGAAALLFGLPLAKWLLTGRGHDADRGRNALKKRE